MLETLNEVVLDVLRQAVDDRAEVMRQAELWIGLLRDPASLGLEFEEPDSPEDRRALESAAGFAQEWADRIGAMSADELRAEISRREALSEEVS